MSISKDKKNRNNGKTRKDIYQIVLLSEFLIKITIGYIVSTMQSGLVDLSHTSG